MIEYFVVWNYNYLFTKTIMEMYSMDNFAVLYPRDDYVVNPAFIPPQGAAIIKE